MADTYNFLVFEPIREEGVEVLRAVGEVRYPSALDEDTLIAEIGDIDGVVLRARGRITRRLLEHAPRLKVAGRHGTGCDNVDVQAATEHGVQVVNTPDANSEAVAEHTVGLMLAVSKRLISCDAAARAGHFDVRYTAIGREMLGRTLGVVGAGRIGRRVAEICHRGFGMHVFYYDIVPVPELECDLGARRLALHELLSSVEYITVHVPLLPQTRGMIGEAEFAVMKPEAMFFNLSRGPVVDEGSLYRALAEGRIAGAGIDVFEEEPPAIDNPLFSLENIVVTPHSAAHTEEAVLSMAMVAEDVVAVLEGRQPKYPVNHLE